ncbi:MAG TPA: hypothetical protein DCE56_31655 [Cyanobacteria bacterium UBA8553]|nr:hypothetical protein [Cyanobacteria bacterium UBA8553]
MSASESSTVLCITQLQSRIATLEQENSVLRVELERSRTQAKQSHSRNQLIEATAIATDCIGSAIERECTQQALLEAEQARSAELAKANEALHNAIAGLARLDNLDQFLAEMLKVSIEISGAQTGAVDLVEGDYIRHAVLFDKAGLVSPQIQAEQGLLRSPFSAEIRAMTQRILQSENAWIVHSDELIHPPSFQAFHREQGNCAIRLVPMRIGDRLLGWLGLGFSEQDPPLGKSFVLLRVLAEQMTMAVELLRLAEAAKQAAIAREQEKAALERAAQLAKANDALKRSLDALAAEPELGKFLAYVLTEIAHQTDACIAYLFLYNPKDNTLKLCTAFQDGQIYFEPASNDPAMFRQPFDADITPGWSRILADRRIIFRTTDNQDDEEIWHEVKAWHIERGHSAHAGIALVAGDQPVGFLGMAWRDRTSLTVEQTELVHALANQATLAIQLTQLAEEAKQAAILEERNHLAREIHDTLAQSFAGIVMQIQAVTLHLADDFEQAKIHLQRTNNLAREGLAEARRSVGLLRQEETAYGDLRSLLQQLVEQTKSKTSIPITLTVTGDTYKLSPDAGINLLRIAQESVNNALRHANATIIQLYLLYAPKQVTLQIRDDGCGFDTQQMTNGFGLKGMQQRADLVGAQLQVISQIGKGTEVNVVLLL